MLRTALSRLAVCLTLLSVGLAHTARADQVVQQTTYTNIEQERDRPSVFEHGYQGLLAGAITGLAGGYLAARRDGFERSDWRAVGLGIGIGSLAGAALGISLGFADIAGARGGRYVARDLMAGVGFGAALGAISGGISALVKDDAEHVLAGTAIGTLVGAGVGIIAGVVQGQMRKRRQYTSSRGFELRPTMAYLSEPQALLPGLAGQF